MSFIPTLTLIVLISQSSKSCEGIIRQSLAFSLYSLNFEAWLKATDSQHFVLNVWSIDDRVARNPLGFQIFLLIEVFEKNNINEKNQKPRGVSMEFLALK